MEAELDAPVAAAARDPCRGISPYHGSWCRTTRRGIYVEGPEVEAADAHAAASFDVAENGALSPAGAAGSSETLGAGSSQASPAG